MTLVHPGNGEGEPTDPAETAQQRPNGLTLQPDNEGGEPSPTRPPTSAEIDAVIAAAMANAPPVHSAYDNLDGRSTPLMTNLLPAAVGADGRVNLFVGNLPYRVRWQDLKDLFRKAGTVLRADVSLGPENRSRGFGTVLMGSREDAARAIDRYNGFSWQTRTLEVRPDRLPPEYEPQPINQVQNGNRGPMYPYNGNHHPHQGPPGHPGWQRPPHMNHGPGGHGHPMTMTNGISMSGPGMYMPHLQPYLNGQMRSHSPALSFTQNGMPMPMSLSGQNTGSHGYGHMGASPLAGSLSVGGGDPILRAGSSASNHHGISPHVAHLALPRAPSPALLGAPGSRPPSSQGHHSASSHGSAHIAPNGASFARASFSSQGMPGEVPFPHRGSIDQGHVPHLEGLGHRGPGLGPPETLHDRVVFVSNLPLSMQWQELKDLLRPAGLIIRADVLTNAEGRPRGFGTALFGAVEDAARAVSLFNGCEFNGQPIRVILERDSQHHDPRRASHSTSQTDTSALGLGQSNDSVSAQELAKEAPASPPAQPRPAPRLASRVPWQLNLQNQSTPVRGSGQGLDSTPRFRNFNPNMGDDSTPHFRQAPHPGPITMPPWNPNEYPNPLSPLQTRGLPPMTPSMPGFVFNNSYPDTPPVPHHFMGPFSPGLPISSPNGFGFNPFLNPAPGAPIYRPHNMGGSAQLGTPTTQAFPVNTARQYPGTPAAPGAPVGDLTNGGYFPPTISETSENPATPTPPPMAPRTASQQVLNARDRLAPTAPTTEQVSELGAMTASMSLNSLIPTGQATPPTPTGRPKRSASGTNLSRLISTNGEGKGNTLVDSEPPSPANGRFSLDEQRPEMAGANGNGERRASLGYHR